MQQYTMHGCVLVCRRRMLTAVTLKERLSFTATLQYVVSVITDISVISHQSLVKTECCCVRLSRNYFGFPLLRPCEIKREH